MNELFIKAAKEKYRFETPRGFLTVEDLYDCPPIGRGVSLDDIAKSVNRQLKETNEESFVVTASKENSILENKLEIVKYIIAEKKAELEKRKNAAERKAKREKLLEAIAYQEDKELREAGTEKLKKMLEELED